MFLVPPTCNVTTIWCQMPSRTILVRVPAIRNEVSLESVICTRKLPPPWENTPQPGLPLENQFLLAINAGSPTLLVLKIQKATDQSLVAPNLKSFGYPRLAKSIFDASSAVV